MSRKLTAPRWGSDGVVLAPRWAIAAVSGRNPELISRHCQPVACDARSRALLYDVDVVEAVMARVPRWPSARRTTSDTCETL